MIDITIVNVALNDIRASFGTPIDQIGWVSTGYMMANIVVIPMTGWFQRRFGFRRYFAGLDRCSSRVASALCGLAWNLPSLVLFRALQGLGGGAIIPTAQSILFARYPKEEHGMAGGLVRPRRRSPARCSGPTIGGYLIEWSSWHWIFLVNVPLGIVAAMLALRFIEEPGFEPPKARSRDRRASASRCSPWAWRRCSTCSKRATARAGSRARSSSCSARSPAIALITFVVHELETEHPVVDLRVFKNRSYTARHRHQLPDRLRAVQRLVPVLAVLRRGHALHARSTSARCSSSSGAVQIFAHAADRHASAPQGRRRASCSRSASWSSRSACG